MYGCKSQYELLGRGLHSECFFSSYFIHLNFKSALPRMLPVLVDTRYQVEFLHPLVLIKIELKWNKYRVNTLRFSFMG